MGVFYLLVLLAAPQVDVEKKWALELKPIERVLAVGDAGVLMSLQTEASDPAVALVPWDTGTTRWTHAWDPKHGELRGAELHGDRVAVFSERRVWLLNAENADVLLEEAIERPAGVLRPDGLHLMTHRGLRLYDRDGHKRWEASAGVRTIERLGGRKTEHDNAILSQEIYEAVTVLVAGYFDDAGVSNSSPLVFRVAHEDGAVTPLPKEYGQSVFFDGAVLISAGGPENAVFSTTTGEPMSRIQNPERGRTTDGRITYDTLNPWQVNGRLSFESGGRLYAIMGKRWGASGDDCTRIVDLESGTATLEHDTTMMSIVDVGDGAAVWTRRRRDSQVAEGLVAFDLKSGKRRWSLDAPAVSTVLTNESAVVLVDRDGLRLLVVDMKDGSIRHELETPLPAFGETLKRVAGTPLVWVTGLLLFDARGRSLVSIPRPDGGFVSTSAEAYRISPDRRHMLYGMDSPYTAYSLTSR